MGGKADNALGRVGLAAGADEALERQLMGGRLSEDNVTQIALTAQDARMWSVEAMLEDSLKQLRSGERSANRAVVVFLDDHGGAYDVGWAQAGMSLGQAVGLLEVCKHNLIRDMGS